MKLDTEPGSAAGTTTDPSTTGSTGGVSDWRASLPEHYEVKDEKTGQATKIPLRADATLGKYKTGEEAARALIEANKQLSKGPLAIPGPDAKPEERRAFFDKLGVPKDAAGYGEVTAPEGVDPAGLTAYLTNVALTTGLTPAQVQASLNFLGEWQASQQRGLIQQWDEGQEELRKEWGYNFDRNHDIAARFLKETFDKAGAGEELPQLLDKLGVGHHPGFIRWMHYLAVNATEDTFVPGAPDAAANASALDAQIKASLEELTKATPGTSAYTALHEKHQALLRQRYGTETATG